MSTARPLTRDLLSKAWALLPTTGIQAIAKDLGIRYGRLRRALMEDDPGRYETCREQKRQRAGQARTKAHTAVTRRQPMPRKRRKLIVMVGWDDADDPVMAKCRADVAQATGLRRMAEFSAEELAALREKVRQWRQHG